MDNTLGKYILAGKIPIPCKSLEKWGEWYETANNNRRVAKTAVLGSEVSTVFLAIDHSFGGGRKPILFETLVFGGPLDQEQMRYSTWEEAEKGHAAMVQRVKDSYGRK